MDYLCWAAGCINLGLSLGFQSYGYHSKSLDAAAKDSMIRATSVHQLASIGFILLSMKVAPLIPTAILTIATCLFPFNLYLQIITKKRNILSRFIPFGGGLHMIFWVTFGLFYFKNNSTLE